MVMFYEEYSSETLALTVERYLNSEFVQPTIGQIERSSIVSSDEANIIVQSLPAQLVQPKNGQMPKILGLTTFTNHIEILCRSVGSHNGAYRKYKAI
jgi:hypothetical protein